MELDVTIEPADVDTAKLLLCFIMMKLNMDLTPDQLYEIAVTSECVNYFLYTEALNELIKKKTILITNNDNQDYYSLADKGKYGIKEFKQYIPKSIRDKALTSALKYFANIKRQEEVEFNLIEAPNGCYLQTKFHDIDNDLMDLKLFVADDEQAEFIKKKILKNPAEFYKNIISFALENEDEKFNLD